MSKILLKDSSSTATGAPRVTLYAPPQVRSSARYMLGAAERQTSGIDILHETSGLQEVASARQRGQL